MIMSSAQTNMSSFDAFKTHTSDNDSASVEKMVPPVATDDGDVITVSDFPKHFEDTCSLYLNEKFSDVILVVDGEKLHAHKAILAARSEYFEALLYDGSQDLKQSELAIKDVSPQAFKQVLKFIYTGTITITSHLGLILEVLVFAHKYSFKNLENSTIQKLKSVLNLKNICSIFNTANLYDLSDLKQACHTFMDQNALEIVTSDCFTELSQKSVIKLLERDTFSVPEIEIFKSVSKWCKVNDDVDGLVIRSVRLSWLTVEDIVSTVWSSKLVEDKKLLGAIAEIVEVKAKTSVCRAKKLTDVNIATPEHKAEVIAGNNTTFLLTGNRNVNKYAYHFIDCKSSITVKLGVPSYLNHINMMLLDKDSRYYSYYIEVSLDQEKWKTVVDYSFYPCRSIQDLYFKEEIAQFVRIVGTSNSANRYFHLVFFEAYFKATVPKIIGDIICPITNVATLSKKAMVIEGINPNELINENFTKYDGSTGYTCHTIGEDKIMVQLGRLLTHTYILLNLIYLILLLAQPYMIWSMKLLLWDLDGRSYRYFIETSVDKSNWKIAADRRNEDCKSWQTLQFDPRPVVYIRITGTHNTVINDNGFYCIHLECPAFSDNK
ncbi:BTB/POZ domain-containing protein 9-like isoform X2 [Tenebrio molitor]|uniref:BTB/POZ domain-containing protein 9-like isoform X2 n=1 Tax=Tenebrio molitor TaxID=7067 RepID=UPI0036247A7E